MKKNPAAKTAQTAADGCAMFHSIAAGAWSALKRIILEKRCSLCGAPLSGLETGRFTPAICPDCLAKLPRRQKGYCPVCGELAAEAGLDCSPCSRCLTLPPPWGKIVFHAAYDGELRKHILQTKLTGGLHQAEALGLLLAGHPFWKDYRKLSDSEKHKQYTCIIPIPLHPVRLAERGFNQSAELAGPLAAFLGLPLRQDILVRTRHTPVQRGLNRQERRLNMRDVFAVPEPADKVKGMRVLLFDDVLTTGATLEAAALALLRAGADAVDLAVIARTPAHGSLRRPHPVQL